MAFKGDKIKKRIFYKNILTNFFDKAKKPRIFGISITKVSYNKLNFNSLIMKNPIPLLSVALAFVIFGSTYFRNLTCPCNIAAIMPITTSLAAIPIAETSKVSETTTPKEITLHFNFADNQVSAKQNTAELEEYLQAHSNSTILISGHTDSRGKKAYNQKLSEARANYVMRMLVKKGIKSTQITTQGKGENVPLSSNDTREGRKLNRRVVVQIFG